MSGASCGSGGSRRSGRQRRVEQLDIVHLQRHVQAVRDFALQRDARPAELRVEAAADELDVLRVDEEVVGGRGVVAGEQPVLGARVRPEERQAAVVVQEVEAELRVAEPRSRRAQRHAVLPVVAGLDVVAALRHRGAHRAVGRAAAARDRRPPCRAPSRSRA